MISNHKPSDIVMYRSMHLTVLSCTNGGCRKPTNFACESVSGMAPVLLADFNGFGFAGVILHHKIPR